MVPEAQGEAFGIRREAEAFRAQTVAEADGEASRFAAILREYENAKGVTRERIFLETMERVVARSSTIVLDTKNGSGVVPYLPLDRLNKKREAK